MCQVWCVCPLWFRRYCYFQIWPIFPFRPWSSKILIDWNQLKKFKQVGIDVKCKHTNFGGHGFSGFRDIATFKISQISFSDNGLYNIYSPWSSKRIINHNQLKKFMLVVIDVKCMQTNFGGHGFSGFGDIATFILSKTAKFPFQTSKILINRNRLKKYMQV